jgi:hypothetical protein
MNTDHTCSYYCDRPECIRAQRDELREKVLGRPMQQWPGPNWQYGCRVCNNGAQVGALGYVCPRSDCPTRITCGGVV